MAGRSRCTEARVARGGRGVEGERQLLLLRLAACDGGEEINNAILMKAIIQTKCKIPSTN